MAEPDAEVMRDLIEAAGTTAVALPAEKRDISESTDEQLVCTSQTDILAHRFVSAMSRYLI